MYTIGQSYCVSYLCGAYLVSDFKNILFIAAMMTLGKSLFTQVLSSAVWHMLTKPKTTLQPTKEPRLSELSLC